VKKLAIVKDKKAFTLLELTVSLFLLIILTLLLMLIIQTTMTTSKRFLDYSNYEYALAHKKILETYFAGDIIYLLLTIVLGTKINNLSFLISDDKTDLSRQQTV